MLIVLDDSTEKKEIADGVSAQYPLRAEPTKNKKEDVQESSTFQPRKRARKGIFSLELAAALDTTKLLDRKATFMIPATARSLGKDIQDFTINRSSIRRAHLSLRQDMSNSVKDMFDTGTPLTVHGAGKLLPDLTGKELVDRCIRT